MLSQSTSPSHLILKRFVNFTRNNGVAMDDFQNTKRFSLGYKDYNKAENTIDVSDKDNTV
jgi:hypothetical protein